MPEGFHLPAIDYLRGRRIHNLGIGKTCIGIGEVGIAESGGRSGGSGIDATEARFGIGIGPGVVGTGID